MKAMTRFLVFLLTMVAGANLSGALAATDYGIYVAETMVNSNNRNNILGDGYFSYNPSTKTLTVKAGAVLNNSGGLGSGISNREVDGLIIEFNGNATFNTRMSSISTDGNKSTKIRLTGGATVKLKSENNASLWVYGKMEVTTVGGDSYMQLEGSTAIAGYAGYTSEFTASGYAHITMKGRNYAMYNLSKVSLGTWCSFAMPGGSYYNTSKNGVVDGNGNVITNKTVKIVPKGRLKEYPIYFGESKINNIWAEDLLCDGSGNITYTGNETKGTLTLRNATFSSGGSLGTAILNRGVADFTVSLIGNSTITGRNSALSVEILDDSSNKLTIEGDGTLNLVSTESSAFSLWKNVTATVKGVTLNAKGKRNAITGDSKARLNFNHAEATLTPGSGYLPISDLGSLTFTDCDIATPAGAYWKNNQLAYTSGEYLPKGTVVTIGQVTKYDIQIDGTPVTSANKNDVLGDGGSVKYDVDYNRIDLNNANIQKSIYIGASAMNGLRINVTGDNVVRGTDMRAALSIENNYVDMFGQGTLRLLDGKYDGIWINKGGLTIKGSYIGEKGPTVYVEQSDNHPAIEGYTGTEKITVDMSTLNAYSVGPVMRNIAQFTPIGVLITAPEGAYYDEGKKTFCYSDGTTVSSDRVVVEEVETYGVEVAGISVHSKNCDAVKGKGITGLVSYDRATNTLYLNNASIVGENWGIMGRDYAEGKGFNINVTGNCLVRGGKYNGISITNTWPSNTTLINGDGTLTIESEENDALYYGTQMTIENLKVSVFSGKKAAVNANNYPLTLRNVELDAQGATAAFEGLSALTLDGSAIVDPEGGAFESSIGSISAASSKNYPAKYVFISRKVTEAYNLLVGGVVVTSDNAANITGENITGSVTFDPTTWTLVLTDATISEYGIDASQEGAYKYVGPQLNIVLNGNNTVDCKTSFPFYLGTPTTISGLGTVTTIAKEGASHFTVLGNNDLELRNCTVNTGSIQGGGIITIDNATLHGSGLLTGFTDMVLKGVDIIVPNSGYYDTTIKGLPCGQPDGSQTYGFEIGAVEYYGVWMDNVQANSANKDDITGEGFTGQVSYDPATQTLTLDGVKLDQYRAAFNVNVDDLPFKKTAVFSGSQLNVVAKGENTLDEGSPFAPKTSIAVSGSGTLRFTNVDLPANVSLTLTGGATLQTKSFVGTTGNVVTVDRSTFNVDGSFSNIDNLVLGERTGIVEPTNGFFSPEARTIVDSKTGIAAESVLIRELTDDEMSVEGISAEGVAISTVYNTGGQRTDRLQRGVNIVRLANGTTRKVAK